MSFLDKKYLLLQEAIHLHHSSVEFSQPISNKCSSLAKAHVVRDYPKGCGRLIHTQKDAVNNEKANNNVAHTKFNGTKDVVRDYPKGCGRHIHTQKDAINNEKADDNVAHTKFNGTKDEEEKKLTKRNLEQSKNFSFENGMSTKMDNRTTSNFMENKSSCSSFPSTLKENYTFAQMHYSFRLSCFEYVALMGSFGGLGKDVAAVNVNQNYLSKKLKNSAITEHVHKFNSHEKQAYIPLNSLFEASSSRSKIESKSRSVHHHQSTDPSRDSVKISSGIFSPNLSFRYGCSNFDSFAVEKITEDNWQQ